MVKVAGNENIFETTNYTQSPTLWFSDCTSISVNQVYKLHSHEGGGMMTT